MLPLVKREDWVEYKMSGKTLKAKVFQSNPTTVWIEDGSGRIFKLHKRRHFIKVVSPPKKQKEAKNSKDKADDPFEGLIR